MRPMPRVPAMNDNDAWSLNSRWGLVLRRHHEKRAREIERKAATQK